MLPGFSFRLKELRIAANFTQEEVASKVKVSRSVISTYETDTRYPSYDILIRLAELYGVTTDYLLGVERKRVIDISGLSEREAATVRDVVECFQKCHSKTE